MIFGLWLGMYSIGEIKPDTSKDARTQKIKQILSSIDSKYVYEVNADSLLDHTLGALLQNLDPHSTYLDARSAQAAEEMIRGKFVGIGVEFMLLKDTATILSVMENSPASKEGLKPGMKLLQIDGEDVYDNNRKSLAEIISKIKGPENSKVNLTFKNNANDSQETFLIARKPIDIPSIGAYFFTDKNYLVISIQRFSENTFKEFDKIIKETAANKPEGIILDLRDNPGGLLSEAAKIMNEFLEKDQLIVYTITRKQERENAVAKGNGRLKDMPLMVLINEGSASASEIIAGAVQDHDRGIVAGRRSYGKGLVQEEINLRDGSKMRLTVAKYFTPLGRNIQKYENETRIEDFHASIKKRFNAEWADSLPEGKDSIYITPKGKKYFGGGGIQPDYWIETTEQEYIQMHFGISNSQNIEAQLLKYALEDLQEWKNKGENEFIKTFTLSPDKVLQLLDIKDETFIDKEKNKAQLDEASIFLKGLIGKILFKPSTFRKVMLQNDAWIKKAETYMWDNTL